MQEAADTWRSSLDGRYSIPLSIPVLDLHQTPAGVVLYACIEGHEIGTDEQI